MIMGKVTMLWEPDQRLCELSASDAVKAMAGDAETGLTETEAAARLTRWGPNILPVTRSRGPLVRLLLQFHNPLIYVLLAAVVAATFMGDHVDAGVILAVVVGNAMVRFVQESRTGGRVPAAGQHMIQDADGMVAMRPYAQEGVA